MADPNSTLPKPNVPQAVPSTPVMPPVAAPTPVQPPRPMPPVTPPVTPTAATPAPIPTSFAAKPATPMTPAPTAVMPPSPQASFTPSPAPVAAPQSMAFKPSTPPPLNMGGGMKPPTQPVPPTLAGSVSQPPSNAIPPVAPKKSALRFLPFVLLLSLVVGIIGFAYYWFMLRDTTLVDEPSDPSGVTKTELTYWGLWEPTTVMDEVFADFEAEHPQYTVTYVQQSPSDYRERLQAEIAAGKGPDLFRFHASWVPMLFDQLSPAPDSVMTNAEFTQTFYPSASTQLIVNDTIVGVPLMVDGLALYYNTDIFTIANRTPPTDWDEVKTIAQELTIKSGDQITRGGIALGTTSNVEHFPEIVALLMLQNGADPMDPTTTTAQDAMRFYLQFGESLDVWDETLPPATEAFAKGDVAMMIAPSWRVHEIKRMNPNLQFAIAPVPQLPGQERVTWASYWAEGVSAESSQKEGAWELIKYLSSAAVQKQFYSEASKIRAFGELYSRQDLAADLLTQPYVAAYIEDAPFAKSSYVNAATHDNGLNDRINKYYEDALNLGGDKVSTSSETLKQGIDEVLQEYGLKVAPTPVVEE